MYVSATPRAAATPLGVAWYLRPNQRRALPGDNQRLSPRHLRGDAWALRELRRLLSRQSSKSGEGKNPNNPVDTGWNAAWTDALFPDRAALEAAVACGTATRTRGKDDAHLPMNCVDWYVANAFCIWDGGRLPTEAEWNYAAAGGDQQRYYPGLTHLRIGPSTRHAQRSRSLCLSDRSRRSVTDAGGRRTSPAT